MRYFKEPEKGAPTPADALSIPQPLFLLLLLLLIRQLLFHSIILDIYSIYPLPSLLSAFFIILFIMYFADRIKRPIRGGRINMSLGAHVATC